MFVKSEDIQCIRVISMQKKTEFISFRTNLTTKAALEAYAAEKKWSLSQVVEQIVQDWVNQNKDTNKQ